MISFRSPQGIGCIVHLLGYPKPSQSGGSAKPVMTTSEGNDLIQFETIAGQTDLIEQPCEHPPARFRRQPLQRHRPKAKKTPANDANGREWGRKTNWRADRRVGPSFSRERGDRVQPRIRRKSPRMKDKVFSFPSPPMVGSARRGTQDSGAKRRPDRQRHNPANVANKRE